jgi:hypothetical protein
MKEIKIHLRESDYNDLEDLMNDLYPNDLSWILLESFLSCWVARNIKHVLNKDLAYKEITLSPAEQD